MLGHQVPPPPLEPTMPPSNYDDASFDSANLFDDTNEEEEEE
jgi:hypothetical protein